MCLILEVLQYVDFCWSILTCCLHFVNLNWVMYICPVTLKPLPSSTCPCYIFFLVTLISMNFVSGTHEFSACVPMTLFICTHEFYVCVPMNFVWCTHEFHVYIPPDFFCCTFEFCLGALIKFMYTYPWILFYGYMNFMCRTRKRYVFVCT